MVSPKSIHRMERTLSSCLIFGLGLPLQAAVFLLVPKLPAVDEVLPEYVGTGGYGGQGVEEGQGEPDAYHGVLLAQCLAGTDAVVPMPADCLADGELDKADKKRRDE